MCQKKKYELGYDSLRVCTIDIKRVVPGGVGGGMKPKIGLWGGGEKIFKNGGGGESPYQVVSRGGGGEIFFCVKGGTKNFRARCARAKKFDFFLVFHRKMDEFWVTMKFLGILFDFNE